VIALTICAGMRVVRASSAMARVIACRIYRWHLPDLQDGLSELWHGVAASHE
jgi:hypothetical protein